VATVAILGGVILANQTKRANAAPTVAAPPSTSQDEESTVSGETDAQ